MKLVAEVAGILLLILSLLSPMFVDELFIQKPVVHQAVAARSLVEKAQENAVNRMPAAINHVFQK